MMQDSQVGLALLGHAVSLRDNSEKDALLDAIRPYVSVSNYFVYERPKFYIAREGDRHMPSGDDSDKEIVLRSCMGMSDSFRNRAQINLPEALRIIGIAKRFETPTDDEFAAAFDALLT